MVSGFTEGASAFLSVTAAEAAELKTASALLFVSSDCGGTGLFSPGCSADAADGVSALLSRAAAVCDTDFTSGIEPRISDSFSASISISVLGGGGGGAGADPGAD